MARSTLTLSLPADVIGKVKILAAQRKTSLSGPFVDCIEDLVARDEAYRAARRRALAPSHGRRFMPDPVFVDSNILVYAHDRSNPAKQAKARRSRASSSGTRFCKPRPQDPERLAHLLDFMTGIPTAETGPGRVTPRRGPAAER